MADGLETAARAIRDARSLFVHTGAGMSADAGVPVFRGPEGFWAAYPPLRHLGLDFQAMATPAWFDKDPPLAWGFFLHRLSLYRAARPHPGHHVLARWAAQRAATVFTSNVDGLHAHPEAPMPGVTYEVHGSIRHLQCTGPCRQRVWALPEALPVVGDDLRALGDLPRCAACGGLARPNVMMFGDWTFARGRADAQARSYIAAVAAAPSPAVVVEVGAGGAVPTVRERSAELVRAGATLVRINPEEPEVPVGHVGLEGTAVEVLSALDARVE